MGLRKTCEPCGFNRISLRGKLTNWTGEDILKIVSENIEELVDPVRPEFEEQTVWEDLKEKGSWEDLDGVEEMDNDDDYVWEKL